MTKIWLLSCLIILCGSIFVAGDIYTDCINECIKHACAPDTHPRNGCNQMYSCSHACKMRQLGLSKDDCKQNCVRNGQSGCNPVVNGYQFDLCLECTRKTCTRFPTIHECEIGCQSYGTPYIPVIDEEMNFCLKSCELNACAPDLDLQTGCNQMYSCSHACKMRQLGLNKAECKQNCVRNYKSGCNPVVNGYPFNLCQTCSRQGCTRFPTIPECQIGCSNYGETPCSACFEVGKREGDPFKFCSVPELEKYCQNMQSSQSINGGLPGFRHYFLHCSTDGPWCKPCNPTHFVFNAKCDSCQLTRDGECANKL